MMTAVLLLENWFISFLLSFVTLRGKNLKITLTSKAHVSLAAATTTF